MGDTLDWTTATRETRRQLQDLPEYTSETILENYVQLLETLNTPEIQAMPSNARAFHCQHAFPKFAIAYLSLIHI